MNDYGDDDDTYQYNSDDLSQSDEEDEKMPPKMRGFGFSWVFLRLHEDLMVARESVDLLTRTKSRSYRGVTNVYNYNCCYSSCGCNKKWRFVTSRATTRVREEETEGDHSNHDLLERNGGRGLSFQQAEIVDEVVALNLSIKQANILHIFRVKAQALLLIGSKKEIVLFCMH